MRKFFRLHDYSENMKAKIDTFSLKGKADIWWEDVKSVKGIHEDYLTWHEFERLFKKKYLLERYYDDREKEFYDFHMGSMIDDDYTNRFLELLRYVAYLKEEKAKVHRFISGLPVAYRYWIEFDDPESSEEAIGKLKHCYEKSKSKVEHKRDLKGNERFKGKWPPKQGIPQDESEKENIVPYKKFNIVENGHGEKLTRGDGREPLQCWLCGKEHHKRDCT